MRCGVVCRLCVTVNRCPPDILGVFFVFPAHLRCAPMYRVTEKSVSWRTPSACFSMSCRTLAGCFWCLEPDYLWRLVRCRVAWWLCVGGGMVNRCPPDILGVFLFFPAHLRCAPMYRVTKKSVSLRTPSACFRCLTGCHLLLLPFLAIAVFVMTIITWCLIKNLWRCL